MAKKLGMTIAEIVETKKVSESQVRRRLKGVRAVGTVDGYQGRHVKVYSKEQIAAAFPKAKKGKKA